MGEIDWLLIFVMVVMFIMGFYFGYDVRKEGDE